MNDDAKDQYLMKDNMSVFTTLKADASRGHRLGVGPYWKRKNKVIEKSIAKFGSSRFRGDSNYIGTSYADNHYIDIRTFLIAFPFNLLRWLLKLPPLSLVLNKQVELTNRYLSELIEFQKQSILNNSDLTSLIGGYKFSEVNTGANDTILFDNNSVTLSQLRYLDVHLGIAGRVDFSKVRSVLEVGGGYGAYTDFLIKNYTDVRKILYVDVFPQLYVGIQYLTAIYGDSVKVLSFNQTEVIHSSSLFKDDDSLEILCISPELLSDIRFEFDLCLSCNAFQEMPHDTCAEYASIFEEKLSEQGSIALVCYENYDGKTQLSVDSIKSIFSVELDYDSKRSLFDLTNVNAYLTYSKQNKSR